MLLALSADVSWSPGSQLCLGAGVLVGGMLSRHVQLAFSQCQTGRLDICDCPPWSPPGLSDGANSWTPVCVSGLGCGGCTQEVRGWAPGFLMCILVLSLVCRQLEA